MYSTINARYPAVELPDKTVLSYLQLQQAIAKLASTLHKQGIQAGQRIGYNAELSLTSILRFFALLQIGASPCLLRPDLPVLTRLKRLEQARVHLCLDTGYQANHPLSSSQILLFTSGSTGVPKLACLGTEHFLANARSSLPHFALQPCLHRWYMGMPLFHVSGLSILFRCLLAGACITFCKDAATHCSAVPTQLQRLIQHPKTWSLILLGGAPCTQKLFQKALQKGLPLYTTFGMTETASHITLSSVHRAGSELDAGLPLPGKSIRLSSMQEIQVQSDSLFYGYEEGKGPLLPLTEDGWFPTGDIGALSAAGHLIHKGRKDDMFLSGGENLYPAEIEQAIGTYPGVWGAYVLSLPDPEFGKRPIAFVWMDSDLPTYEQWREYLLTLLPKFAIPDAFYPIPPEMLSQGKIQKDLLPSLIAKKKQQSLAFNLGT